MNRILFLSAIICSLFLFSCSDSDDSSDSNSGVEEATTLENQIIGQWKLSKRFLKDEKGEVIQETPIKGCSKKTLIQFNSNKTYRENSISGDNEGVNCQVLFDESGTFKFLNESLVEFTTDGITFLVEFKFEKGILEQKLLNKDPNDLVFETDEYIRVTEEQEFFEP